MESFMKADVFFFISSVSSIISSILLVVLLVYLIRIARDVHVVTQAIRNGVEQSEALIGSIFEFIKNTFVSTLFGSSSSKKRRVATKKENESSD